MHTSLTISIVVVIVILIVILITSPTCKNAVSGVLKGEKRQVVQRKAPVETLSGSNKEFVDFQKVHASRTRSKRPQVLVNNIVQEAAKNAPPKQPVEVTAPVHKPIPHAVPVVEKKSLHVLSGNVLDMFSKAVNLEKEFGITESQLDKLAENFHKKNVETHKEPVTRHRSLIRDQIEAGDKALTEGFMASAKTKIKPDVDELLMDKQDEHKKIKLRSRKAKK